MTDLSNSDDNDELNHRTINYFETKINLTDKNKNTNLPENLINNETVNNNKNTDLNPVENKEDTETIENNIIDENSFSNIIDNDNENENEDDISNGVKLEIKNVMNDNIIEEPQTGITARKVKNNNINANNNNNNDNISLKDNKTIENNNENVNKVFNNINSDKKDIKKNILDENFSGNENFIHCRNCLKFFSYYLSKNFINN